jgi:hypothetical protein
MVFNHEKYCSNTWAANVVSSFRFLWQFEPRDAYYRNRQTNMYQFSQEFLTRADDINCYRMEPSFIIQYPEFTGDIPLHNSVSPQIDLPIWRLFPPQRLQRLHQIGHQHQEDEGLWQGSFS